MTRPDPTLLLSAAVGARIASELEDIPGMHVAVGIPGMPVGHVISALRLGEDGPGIGLTLCRPGWPRPRLGLLADQPARLLPLCRQCTAKLAKHRRTLEPTRWERAAWCHAELLAAVAAGDIDRREDAISAAIAAGSGVHATLGEWMPGSPHTVPLHQFIALWRTTPTPPPLRPEPPIGRYRNGYALRGRAR